FVHDFERRRLRTEQRVLGVLILFGLLRRERERTRHRDRNDPCAHHRFLVNAIAAPNASGGACASHALNSLDDDPMTALRRLSTATASRPTFFSATAFVNQ